MASPAINRVFFTLIVGVVDLGGEADAELQTHVLESLCRPRGALGIYYVTFDVNHFFLSDAVGDVVLSQHSLVGRTKGEARKQLPHASF